MSNIGYDDTPFLPEPYSQWRVHDGQRPQPTIVTPGATSADAPSDAVILFDGTDLSGWQTTSGGQPEWIVENGYMQVTPRTGDIVTKAQFSDCQLHLEWASPVEVKGEGQGRGNSGIFLMGLYEVQVLDGYDNQTYADGITGAIYAQFPPRVNACRPPGEWQTYDIVFEAPKYQGADLVSPAYLTVFLNGILLHNRQPAHGPTGHRNLSSYDSVHGPTGPLKLQDHCDLVKFRNIWMRQVNSYDQA